MTARAIHGADYDKTFCKSEISEQDTQTTADESDDLTIQDLTIREREAQSMTDAIFETVLGETNALLERGIAEVKKIMYICRTYYNGRNRA